jgi:hypothetical protein
MRIIPIAKLFIAFNLLIASINVNAITIYTTIKGSVSTVHEASGIDWTGGSSYWTHNDGYGDNHLYKLTSTGALSKTITVTGAINNDWEDITSNSDKTFMYIGDFGNNNQNRTNLHIYRITYPSLVSGTSVAAQTISFHYPDQNHFPARWWNFDAESLFHHNGKLYIFTKADGNAIGYTKLYTVPDQPGNYTATFIDSFAISGRITSADISPDGTTAALISNTNVYLFRNFTGTNIFHGTYTKLSIAGSWTQKEGVCFNSSNTLCMIDEGTSNKLYQVNIGAYCREASEKEIVEPKVETEPALSIYPNPSSDFFNVRNTGEYENAQIIFSDITGKVINTFPMQSTDAEIRVETADLQNGIYFIQVFAGDERKSSARVIVSH